MENSEKQELNKNQKSKSKNNNGWTFIRNCVKIQAYE